MNHLKDKVAIVTGASSGIGEATAIALAEAGAKVVLAARRTDRLQQLKERIKGDCLLVPTDVSNRSDVENLVKTTKDTYGKVDILINNAGVMLLSFLDKLHVEEWDRMIDVNIKGVLYGAAAVIPIMKEQKNGHIVNVASIAGHRVIPAASVYCGTKFAVRAISEGLRMELSPQSGIRVTIISPGIVQTELTHHITDPDVQQSVAKRSLTPLTSEDIANAIVYAVSQPQHVNVNEIMVRPTEQPN
ncbi:SDR family oxidoreductase [Effusibacillus dendaii]|uniref:SDR family oxidoreductase n=1 Tax=Effusibacillus dendaii TaxID=2743772 RepID=UPI0038512A79